MPPHLGLITPVSNGIINYILVVLESCNNCLYPLKVLENSDAFLFPGPVFLT